MSEQFRAGVGFIITNSQRLVLAVERNSPRGAWQLPQGGVEAGESCIQALYRELYEELALSATCVELLAEHPVWLGYELPTELRSSKTNRGQVHRWFLLRMLAADDAIHLARSGELASWKWMPLAELVQFTVEFRRPVYETLISTFRAHLS